MSLFASSAHHLAGVVSTGYTDLFLMEMIMTYCVGTSIGYGNESWDSLDAYMRVFFYEVMNRPVWCLCLSDSSLHSNWATHLWAVRCEGTHSIPPLTKYWCNGIAANHSFHLYNVRNLTCWLFENDVMFTSVLTPFPKHILYSVYTLGIGVLKVICRNGVSDDMCS